MKRSLLCLLALLLALGGCNFYRPEINQGNQTALLAKDKVKPGMSKGQVADIMGTPLNVAPFDEDTWEYWFVRSKGTSIKEKRGVQLHFRNNRLISITPLS